MEQNRNIEAAAMWFGYSPVDVLTAILVTITAVYAGLTYSIARSNKAMVDKVAEQIELQSRPVITTAVGVRARVVFFLRISNQGVSTAQRLRLEMNRSFYRFSEKSEDHDISKLHLFTKEIATFAPGELFEIDLSQGFNINIEIDGENISPDQFTISATYYHGSRQYSEIFHIDLRPYMGTRGPYTEADQLERIEQVLERKL